MFIHNFYLDRLNIFVDYYRYINEEIFLQAKHDLESYIDTMLKPFLWEDTDDAWIDCGKVYVEGNEFDIKNYYTHLLGIVNILNKYDKHLYPLTKGIYAEKLLSGKKIFLCTDTAHVCYLDEPQNLIIDFPLLPNIKRALVKITGRKVLNLPYMNMYATANTEDTFYNMLYEAGAISHLPIYISSAQENPNFKDHLFSERTITDWKIDIDYKVAYEHSIFSPPNKEGSILLIDLCNMINQGYFQYRLKNMELPYSLEYNNSYKKAEVSDCRYAYYSPNNNAPIKKCYSQFLNALLEKNWLPHKNGNFYRPADILPQDIDISYTIIPEQLLDLIPFGENVRIHQNNIKDAINLLEKEGMIVLQPEEIDTYMKFKELIELLNK